jgi:hypothetical protein
MFYHTDDMLSKFAKRSVVFVNFFYLKFTLKLYYEKYKQKKNLKL